MNEANSSGMRIAQLTPGTGHFHCGSCLRDHALCQALRRRGHDATMVPLYLPFVLDGSSPDDEVQMGGVNLYLAHAAPWTRRLPAFLHRWLDRPGFLRWSSRRGDMTDASSLGPMTLAILEGEHGGLSEELERFAEWMTHVDRPQVLSLSNVMLLGLVRPLKRRLGVPLICSLQGEEPFLDALPKKWRERAWAALREWVGDVDHFVAVSRWYGERMAERLGLSEDRWSVVHNGIDLDALAGAEQRRAPAPETPTIGYMARLCEDKGLPTLVDAFLELRRRGSVPGLRLLACGAQVKADRRLERALRKKIERAGATEDVHLQANVSLEQKVEALRLMSVLSVPATYGESFGLYLLEALAFGVPVVQPRHAAFPEVLDATGGGVLCEPDDPISLADGLESLLLDRSRRATRRWGSRGARGWRSRLQTPTRWLGAWRRSVRWCVRVSSPLSPTPLRCHGLRVQRRQRTVEFAETDMAGIVHFSNFFRWMEATEHAFFRSLGFTLHHQELEGRMHGWARCAGGVRLPPSGALWGRTRDSSCLVVHKGRTSLGYRLHFAHVGGEEVAVGQLASGLRVPGSRRNCGMQRDADSGRDRREGGARTGRVLNRGS